METFINEWTDTYGYTWNVQTTGEQVSGTVTTNRTGCPTVTYSVSGSISPSPQVDGTEGSTYFTWYANNPSPSGYCSNGLAIVPFSYSGTIQNDGNDLAVNVSWTNSQGSGTTTVTKAPSDIPTSESTMAIGFSSGEYATLGQFRQILGAASGSTDIFQGRQVLETTGFGQQPYYDSCWFPESAYPQWNTVTGSAWNVGYYAIDPPYITSLNEWGDDYIGWPPNIVTYYQSYYDGSGKSPFCGARVPQEMFIRTGGTAGSSQYYAGDTIGEDIYLDHVTAYRAGVSQSTNFPQ